MCLLQTRGRPWASGRGNNFFGPRAGVWFPNALQGYSVLAQREQMASLPECFLLSGLDTPFAMAMYPDVLARDWNTPGLELAAFQWQAPSISLCFKASNDGLCFDDLGDLGSPRDYHSGGLLVLG